MKEKNSWCDLWTSYPRTSQMVQQLKANVDSERTALLLGDQLSQELNENNSKLHRYSKQ